MQQSSQTKNEPEQQVNKLTSKIYIGGQVSRALHLFSMAYIVGQSFTIFNMGAVSQLSVGGGSGYIIEMLMLLVILLSGLANAYFRMHEGSPECEGRKNWLYILAAKTVMLVFLTPVTDMIALSWVGSPDQTTLTEAELYFVRSLKFVLVIASFTLGYYSRIYREDVTLNFSTKKIKTNGGPATQEEIVKEPLLN